MAFRTAQEALWHGSFGEDYIARNSSDALESSNTALFVRALQGVGAPASVLELGANIGMNLSALRRLFPDADLNAVEINPVACEYLRGIIPAQNVIESSILEFTPDRGHDLVLIKGVLIHISPEALVEVYRVAVESCARYLLICEYYNPTPVEVPYRGQSASLFKRDFCGEILDLYPEMHLRDYGFIYHRDTSFPLDDISWFLLERKD